jgi:hypothetical protein
MFEVLMAVNCKIVVFWDVAPFGLVDKYQYLKEPAAYII